MSIKESLNEERDYIIHHLNCIKNSLKNDPRQIWISNAIQRYKALYMEQDSTLIPTNELMPSGV